MELQYKAKIQILSDDEIVEEAKKLVQSDEQMRDMIEKSNQDLSKMLETCKSVSDSEKDSLTDSFNNLLTEYSVISEDEYVQMLIDGRKQQIENGNGGEPCIIRTIVVEDWWLGCPDKMNDLQQSLPDFIDWIT